MCTGIVSFFSLPAKKNESIEKSDFVLSIHGNIEHKMSSMKKPKETFMKITFVETERKIKTKNLLTVLIQITI